MARINPNGKPTYPTGPNRGAAPMASAQVVSRPAVPTKATRSNPTVPRPADPRGNSRASNGAFMGGVNSSGTGTGAFMGGVNSSGTTGDTNGGIGKTDASYRGKTDPYLLVASPADQKFNQWGVNPSGKTHSQQQNMDSEMLAMGMIGGGGKAGFAGKGGDLVRAGASKIAGRVGETAAGKAVGKAADDIGSRIAGALGITERNAAKAAAETAAKKAASTAQGQATRASNKAAAAAKVEAARLAARTPAQVGADTRAANRAAAAADVATRAENRAAGAAKAQATRAKKAAAAARQAKIDRVKGAVTGRGAAAVGGAVGGAVATVAALDAGNDSNNGPSGNAGPATSNSFAGRGGSQLYPDSFAPKGPKTTPTPPSGNPSTRPSGGSATTVNGMGGRASGAGFTGTTKPNATSAPVVGAPASGRGFTGTTPVKPGATPVKPGTGARPGTGTPGPGANTPAPAAAAPAAAAPAAAAPAAAAPAASAPAASTPAASATVTPGHNSFSGDSFSGASAGIIQQFADPKIKTNTPAYYNALAQAFPKLLALRGNPKAGSGNIGGYVINFNTGPTPAQIKQMRNEASFTKDPARKMAINKLLQAYGAGGQSGTSSGGNQQSSTSSSASTGTGSPDSSSATPPGATPAVAAADTSTPPPSGTSAADWVKKQLLENPELGTGASNNDAAAAIKLLNAKTGMGLADENGQIIDPMTLLGGDPSVPIDWSKYSLRLAPDANGAAGATVNADNYLNFQVNPDVGGQDTKLVGTALGNMIKKQKQDRAMQLEQQNQSGSTGGANATQRSNLSTQNALEFNDLTKGQYGGALTDIQSNRAQDFKDALRTMLADPEAYGYVGPTKPEAPTTTPPVDKKTHKIGDTLKWGGKTHRWNGAKWVAIKPKGK